MSTTMTEAACATIERAVAFVNDVDLLAEEIDPHSGELLGNFPQAFSHIGLVNAHGRSPNRSKGTSRVPVAGGGLSSSRQVTGRPSGQTAWIWRRR